MDTKYWGPSGWKLLHTITFAHPSPTGQKKAILKRFFQSLPFVLPCKYCRASLTEYMEALPVENALESAAPYALARWLWKIHNCVNDKLRKQHLTIEDDPSFEDVKRFYLERMALSCSMSKFEGWEFLFSVAENHPYSKQSLTGKPMKDFPGKEHLAKASIADKNRWNVLTPEERLVYTHDFWTALPELLPYKEWRSIWESSTEDWSSRKTSLQTLWKKRCNLEEKVRTYASLCQELRAHRSGCSKSIRAKTCRKRRNYTR
jgi:hypothetical protein